VKAQIKLFMMMMFLENLYQTEFSIVERSLLNRHSSVWDKAKQHAETWFNNGQSWVQLGQCWSSSHRVRYQEEFSV